MSTPPSSDSPSDAAVPPHNGPGRVPAPGWYPTPSGEQRYWDGSQWLELPPPAATTLPFSAPQTSETHKRRTGKWLAIAGAVALVLALAGGGLAWKANHDEQIAAEEAEAAAAESAAAEREREERREEAAEAAQQRRESEERASRRASVPGIESSVKAMAEGHVADGILDGPILEVTCSPVGGGSTDDLTEQTTVFECFAANQDNGDGTMSGYTYNATMNWSTGRYTYGLGAP